MDEDRVEGTLEQAEGKAQEAWGEGKEKVGADGAADQAEGKAKQSEGKLQETFGEAKDKAGELSDKAKGTLGGDKARPRSLCQLSPLILLHFSLFSRRATWPRLAHAGADLGRSSLQRRARYERGGPTVLLAPNDRSRVGVASCRFARVCAQE